MLPTSSSEASGRPSNVRMMSVPNVRVAHDAEPAVREADERTCRAPRVAHEQHVAIVHWKFRECRRL